MQQQRQQGELAINQLFDVSRLQTLHVIIAAQLHRIVRQA
jgi:hypothetical protein